MWKSFFLVAFLIFCLVVKTEDLVNSYRGNVAVVSLNRFLAAKNVLEDLSVPGDEFYSQPPDTFERMTPTMARVLTIVYTLQGETEMALAASDVTGEGSEAFLQRGHNAHKAQRYHLASQWYNLAMIDQPALGDAWFFMGKALAERGDVPGAIDAYEQAYLKSDFSDIGRSDILYQLAFIYENREGVLDLETALSIYEQALVLDEFSADDLTIQTHFRKAETLRSLGYREQALSEYEWVITRQPDHYWAHIRLGYMVWQHHHDLKQAEALFQRAVQISDEQKWAYQGLGRLYQESGQVGAATEMFQVVLRIDPQDQDALTQLEKLQETRP